MCIMLTLPTIVSGNLTNHLLHHMHALILYMQFKDIFTSLVCTYAYMYAYSDCFFCIYILTALHTSIHILTFNNIYISDSITTPTLPLPSLDPPSSLAGSETSPISDPMREARHATAELQRRCRSKFSVFEKK